MNRDSRSITLAEDVKRLSQYERLYARLVCPIDTLQNESYLSKDGLVELYKAYSALSSCVIEAEKLSAQLMQEFQTDIIQQRQREESTRHAKSGRNNLSLFEAISDPQSIVEDSIALSFQRNHPCFKWASINILRLSYESLHHTFMVIDYDDISKPNATRYVLTVNDIIGFSGMNPAVRRTTRDYTLPAGKRVLCLWPNSTTFYPATVVSRENAPSDMIVIQFDDVEYYSVLPYSHVVPLK